MIRKDVMEVLGKLNGEELVEVRKWVEERIAKDLKVGESVWVEGIASWEGWTGKLVKVEGEKAYIELIHKEKGKKVYPTMVRNVRKGEYPKKK